MLEREWRSGSAAKLRQRRRPILSALAYSKRSVLRPQFHFLNFGTQRFRVKAGKLYPFFALSEIADTSSCFFSQYSCPFFAFFAFSDTVLLDQARLLYPFFVLYGITDTNLCFICQFCILLFRFSRFRTQVNALKSIKRIPFFAFFVFSDTVLLDQARLLCPFFALYGITDTIYRIFLTAICVVKTK